MRKLLIGVGVMGLWLGCLAAVHGQQTTEMFIPIGQSPGVSGKSSLIGKIESVNAGKRALAIAGPSGTEAVMLTDRTRIWVDRTQANLSNRTGTVADLQKGRTVECKYRQTDGKRVAEWVKVQVVEAGTSPRAGQP
jgi:hypothetical protein